MTETHTIGSSYPPPPEFAANANATAELYRRAEADRLGFWAEQANRLSWDTPIHRGAGLVGGAVREVGRLHLGYHR
jgi:Acetyl-coenzyme A synthetase N-terminus